MPTPTFSWRLARHAMDLDDEGHDVGQAGKWKQPVRAASTANGTLATAFEEGDTLDGVTLVALDRILLKDQTTGSQNGIYVVQPTGAPVRADDFDDGGEVLGTVVTVIAGTANGGKAYRLTNTTTPTIGTTTLTFAEFGGGAPSGAAGGDLSGTYPNPSVVDDSHSHGASTVAIPLDDLTDVVITSPAASQAIRYDGTNWVNTSGIWRPLMDGAGNVITDGGTGEAVMALSP